MENRRFNSILSNVELGYRCRLNNSILSNVEVGYRCRLTKGMDPFATDWEYLAKTSKFNSISEDPILNDTDKRKHP